MGNTKLRRLNTVQNKWTDPDSSRHKHSFTRHATMCLNTADGFVHYFDIMCCTKCHSFKCIAKEHNVSGLITNTSDIDATLPMLMFKTNHNMRIGFSDLIFITEKIVRYKA